MVLQSSRVARQALRTDPNPLPAGEVVELPRLRDDANLAPVFAEMRDDHSRGLLTDWAFVAGTRQWPKASVCWMALMRPALVCECSLHPQVPTVPLSDQVALRSPHR